MCVPAIISLFYLFYNLRINIQGFIDIRVTMLITQEPWFPGVVIGHHTTFYRLLHKIKIHRMITLSPITLTGYRLYAERERKHCRITCEYGLNLVLFKDIF